MERMRREGWADVVGPSFTAAGMADELGWTETEVACAGEELRLLAVRTSDDVVLFPAFQLLDGRVVAGLTEVLQVLRTGTASRWTWAQFLNVARPGEMPHIHNLREGHLDDVLDAARREAVAWGE